MRNQILFVCGFPVHLDFGVRPIVVGVHRCFSRICKGTKNRKVSKLCVCFRHRAEPFAQLFLGLHIVELIDSVLNFINAEANHLHAASPVGNAAEWAKLGAKDCLEFLELLLPFAEHHLVCWVAFLKQGDFGCWKPSAIARVLTF